jgi:hypothetical protein
MRDMVTATATVQGRWGGGLMMSDDDHVDLAYRSARWMPRPMNPKEIGA